MFLPTAMILDMVFNAGKAKGHLQGLICQYLIENTLEMQKINSSIPMRVSIIMTKNETFRISKFQDFYIAILKATVCLLIL